MKRTSVTVRGAAAAAGVALALAACGGGGHDHDDGVTDSVPSSASQSADGFIDYLVKLVASSADTKEPVDVSTVTPPADDASEPRPID